MRVVTLTALLAVFASSACRRRAAKPPARVAAPPPACDHWADCVDAVVATRGGIYVTSARWNGAPRLIWPPNVPIPLPLTRAAAPGGGRVSVRAMRPLVGAALRVDDDDTLLDPPWCRGGDPACAPARDAAWHLAIAPPSHGGASLALDGTGALQLRERPPFGGPRRTRGVELPCDFAPRQIDGSNKVICALSTQGEVRCWNRQGLENGPSLGERRYGVRVDPLCNAANEEIVVGPMPRFGDALVCARTRRGAVRCVWIGETMPDDLLSLAFGDAALRGVPGPVRSIALGTHDLCLTHTDGRVSCAVGPGRTHAHSLTGEIIDLHVVPALEGAAELAVAPGMGCARWPTRRLRCWGPELRASYTGYRRTPVELRGIDAATRLVVGYAFGCALQRGSLVCFGEDRRYPSVEDDRYAATAQDGTPWPVPLDGPITDATFVPTSMSGGSNEAREGISFVTATGGISTQRSPPAAASGVHRWSALTGLGYQVCARDDDGSAWCSTWEPRGITMERRPAFDRYDTLHMVNGVPCALRRGRPLRCDDRDAFPRPRSIPALRDVVGVLDGSCLVTARGRVRCVDGSELTPAAITPAMLAELGGGLTTASGWWRFHCALGVNGRVACVDAHGPWVVEGIDDAREIIVSGFACARRASGRVACWGEDVANMLAAAVDPQLPELAVPASVPVR